MKALITASVLAIIAATPAMAQKQTVVIGTGAEGNPYWNAAGKLSNIFRDTADLQPKNLGGSEAITYAVAEGTEAQAGFIQSDALIKAQENGLMGKIRVVGPVGREYSLVVCGPRSGIEDSGDLQGASPPPKLIVGKEGSGFVITLDKWTEEDSSFSNRELVYESPSPDDGAVADLLDNTAQCLALNTALSGGVIKAINEASNGRLHLIEIDDWDLDDAVTPKAADGSGGDDIYSYTEVNSEQFPGLIKSGSVETVSQATVMIANDAWAAKNPDIYRRLRGVVSREPNLVK